MKVFIEPSIRGYFKKHECLDFNGGIGFCYVIRLAIKFVLVDTVDYFRDFCTCAARVSMQSSK